MAFTNKDSHAIYLLTKPELANKFSKLELGLAAHLLDFTYYREEKDQVTYLDSLKRYPELKSPIIKKTINKLIKLQLINLDERNIVTVSDQYLDFEKRRLFNRKKVKFDSKAKRAFPEFFKYLDSNDHSIESILVFLKELKEEKELNHKYSNPDKGFFKIFFEYCYQKEISYKQMDKSYYREFINLIYPEPKEKERTLFIGPLLTHYVTVNRNRAERYFEHIYNGLSYEDSYDFSNFYQKHEDEYYA